MTKNELLEQALYKLRDCQEAMIENGLTQIDREWWGDLCELIKNIRTTLEAE